MALVEVVAPTGEPISIAEVKEHLRIDHARDDAKIRVMITAARQYGEHLTRRAWFTKTLELILDEFSEVIYLPRPPLQSVTSVKYIDPDGVQQTVDPGDYVVFSTSLPPMIYPVYNGGWPATRDVINAVTIRYIAGMVNFPAIIKEWMFSRIGAMYENREALIVGQPVTEMPRNFVDGLLDPYRVKEIQ